MTTSPSKLNELNHAETPARALLEQIGWTYLPREVLAQQRGDQRDVLLKGRLKKALLRLNEWMTEEQANRAIFDLRHIDATGMARNSRVHEYLTYGMPSHRGLGARGPDPHRPLLRLRQPGVGPQRVHRHHPVPGPPQLRPRPGGRRAHGHPGPGPLRQRHSPWLLWRPSPHP